MNIVAEIAAVYRGMAHRDDEQEADVDHKQREELGVEPLPLDHPARTQGQWAP